MLVSDISDYLPVFVCSKQSVLRKKVIKYQYKRIINTNSINQLYNNLSKRDWSVVNENSDVNDANSSFINMFRAEFESCCQIKKFRVQVMSKKKPWITKGLENACKKKNNLYRNFLKCKSTSSLCRYKAYKNKLTTALRYAEKEYFNRLLYQKKDDIKGTWKIINSMIKGNKSIFLIQKSFMIKVSV